MPMTQVGFFSRAREQLLLDHISDAIYESLALPWIESGTAECIRRVRIA